MGALVVRIVLLAAGIGLAEMAVDALARGLDVALVQGALALGLLAAGSAGFAVPLLARGRPKEAGRDV
jgi:hypothetical protein